MKIQIIALSNHLTYGGMRQRLEWGFKQIGHETVEGSPDVVLVIGQSALWNDVKQYGVPVYLWCHGVDIGNFESANNKKMDIDKLIIKEIRVDKGPISKRWMPRAQGRSTPIHKVTSHVILTLAQSDKKLEPRFIIETKRPKKVKKEKKEVVAENKDRSSKIHHHPAPEKKTEPKEETRKEGKPERRGFLKRMFRRKSV